MKRLLFFLATPLLFVLFTVQSAHAAVPTILPPVSTPAQPNIIISAFSGGQPEIVEFYNQSTKPIFLGGRTAEVRMTGLDAANVVQTEQFTINLPAAYLLPKQYLMMQRDMPSNANIVAYKVPVSTLSTIKLVSVTFDGHVITPGTPMAQNEWVQHKQRGNASLKLTDVFATDYGVPKTTGLAGNADLLYAPPVSSQLQILELLPNARTCAPTESAYDCGDYIKLHNPTTAAIDLSQYRLRSDSGGLKSSSSNTFALAGLLNPGEYMVINTRASGDPISLTNTGGYVWLEDAWGVKIYGDPVAYPDASADSKKGQSWAVDSTGAWQWMAPAPTGANYWPPVVPEPVAVAVAANTLTPCKEGQERNAETNRCRSIVSVATAFTPCKIGQERNSETNRCRSVLAAATTLTPCKTGETRNLDTNRCRKDTATSSTLTSCKPGYERNTETNRCRKSQSAVNTASITDVKTNQLTNKRAWWLAGAIILAALAYAIYEWRQDLWLRLKRH